MYIRVESQKQIEWVTAGIRKDRRYGDSGNRIHDAADDEAVSLIEGGE